MKRIRYKLVSWDEGRAFMKRLSDDLATDIKEIEEYLRIENDQLMASCQFDVRDFSFIYIELQDESLEDQINSLLSEFQAK